MQKISENYKNKSKIDLLEEEINNEVLTSDIEDIVDVTYSYSEIENWFNWNISLFTVLLWEDFENDIKNIKIVGLKNYLLEKKSLIVKKLNNKIIEINNYLNELELINDLDEKNNIKKVLLQWALNYAKTTLEITLIWLDFELEKAWADLDISNDEIEKRVNGIWKLEKKIFWPKISESLDDIVQVYEFIRWRFEDNKENLNLDEQSDYENYLKFLNKKIVNINSNYEYSKPKKKEIPKALKMLLHRDDAIRYVAMWLRASWINKDIVLSSKYSNLNDKNEALYWPSNNDYEFKQIEYINWVVLAHELGHMVTNEEWIKNFKWIKWPNYLAKEEWNMTNNEKIVRWDSIFVANWEPRLLIWEFFNWSDTEKFINLHNKLNPDIKSWNILRNKRNYPMNWVWSQSKDLAYWSWLRKIRNIIESEPWKIKRFYIGKMNFDFIDKYWDDFLVSDKVLYPVLIAELMNYYAEWYYSDKDFKLDHEWFSTHIKDRYSFLDVDSEDFDWIRNEVFKSREIVRYINWMKKIIKETIDKTRE